MRAERTRRRLTECAVRLFAEQGYDATTVTQIAAAAGVSHMTFFRHFPSKEDVIVGDPYDPVIAQAVAAQPTALPPFERARAGLRVGWAQVAAELDGDDVARCGVDRQRADHPAESRRSNEHPQRNQHGHHANRQSADDGLRLRLGIIARHPGLRARMWESQHATQQAIATALRDGGAAPVAAQAAAGACLGALIWALLAWAEEGPDRSFASVVREALETIDGAPAHDQTPAAGAGTPR